MFKRILIAMLFGYVLFGYVAVSVTTYTVNLLSGRGEDINLWEGTGQEWCWTPWAEFSAAAQHSKDTGDPMKFVGSSGNLSCQDLLKKAQEGNFIGRKTACTGVDCELAWCEPVKWVKCWVPGALNGWWLAPEFILKGHECPQCKPNNRLYNPNVTQHCNIKKRCEELTREQIEADMAFCSGLSGRAKGCPNMDASQINLARNIATTSSSARRGAQTSQAIGSPASLPRWTTTTLRVPKNFNSVAQNAGNIELNSNQYTLNCICYNCTELPGNTANCPYGRVRESTIVPETRVPGSQQTLQVFHDIKPDADSLEIANLLCKPKCVASRFTYDTMNPCIRENCSDIAQPF